jgi:hypothetical protein
VGRGQAESDPHGRSGPPRPEKPRLKREVYAPTDLFVLGVYRSTILSHFFHTRFTIVVYTAVV